MSLKTTAYDSVRWTSASFLVKAIVQTLQIVILARTLESTSVGEVAIMLAVLGFVQATADMGISTAIIHYKNISNAEYSSLFWMNILTSSFFAGILLLASDFIAGIYNVSSVSSLLKYCALVILINGLSIQLRIRAQKALQFKVLSLIEIFGSLSSLLMVTICLLVLSKGSAAIVFGAITNAIIICVLSWKYLAEGWLPRFTFKYLHLQRFIGFGLYTLLGNICNTLNTQLDILLGGKYLSLGDIGAYSLNKDLSIKVGQVLNPVISKVSTPLLARLQSEVNSRKRVYLRTLNVVSSVNSVIYSIMIFYPVEVISLAFGEKWSDYSNVLFVLAILGLVRSTSSLIGSLIISMGYVRRSFYWNLFSLIVSVFVITFGSKFGAIGIATSKLILSLIFMIPIYWLFVFPLIESRFVDYFMVIAKPICMAVVAGIISLAAVSFFDVRAMSLMFGSIVLVGVYIILSFLLNRSFILACAEVFNVRLPTWIKL